MGLGGSGGIFMDGFTLQQPKRSCSSSSVSKRYQEDETHTSSEFQSHRLDSVSESSSRSSSSESSRKDRGSPKQEVSHNDHESLQQEILHLEEQLETQIKLRHALETCLGYKSSPSSEDDIGSTLLPKDAAELIQEVATLEVEVAHLEKYFLHLYQKAVYKKVAPSLPSTNKIVAKSRRHEVSSPEQDDIDDKSSDSTDCVISMSAPSAYIPKSTTEEIEAKSVRACQSMRLPMTRNNSGISLAKRLGTRFSDLLPETPNKLSEEMVRHMAAIYCKLSDPPLMQFSQSSRSFSMSHFSADEHNNMWSPALSFDDEKLDNPFTIEGLLDPSGPYSTLMEVPSIYRDDQKLGEVEYLLQDYQSIISRLKEVDPRKLSHEERLAFWINVHNSLVMNAFVAYGIPGNSVKRATCLSKAAYNIGGQSISAYTIQSSILRCRMSHAGQWLRRLIPSRSMLQSGGEYEAYAINKPEPLLYFALSCGGFSDPAVAHAFTPTFIFHELETAKNDYIRATLGIAKKRKIFLPKLVESFSRDSSISQDKVLKTILQSLPEAYCKRVKKCLASSKSSTTIEWIPHDSTFRYLISKELVKHTMARHSKIFAL